MVAFFYLMKFKQTKYFHIVVILLVDVLAFSYVNAQSLSTSDKFNIKLSIGKNISVSDYIATGTSNNVYLGAEYWLPRKRKSNIGFDFEVGYGIYTGKGNNLGLPESFKTKAFSIGTGFSYRYFFTERFSPFISLGSSFYKFSFSDKNFFSEIIKQKNGEDNNSFGLNSKIGANYILSNLLTLSFEVGLHFILSDNLDAIKIGIHNDYFTDFNIGVSYNIFAEKDSDNDGIADSKDQCPYKAEDYDGFEDEDGCPDLDNDNDGIPDSIDVCVNLAEDIDGFEDNDGCPDLDNDKDGIKDIDDKCPNKPEDYDGFEDTDGCPDVDNDNDGILDINDKCPNIAENKNGYQDDDGCPDVVPYSKKNAKPEVKIPYYFILTAEQIFNRNTNTIKKTAANRLQKIVKIMKQNPDILWKIEGHVEKQKSHLESVKLSKKLISAIKMYLIAKGIPAKNLKESAIGDAAPIASNKTVFGRMKNRRIKIIRLN